MSTKPEPSVQEVDVPDRQAAITRPLSIGMACFAFTWWSLVFSLMLWTKQSVLFGLVGLPFPFIGLGADWNKPLPATWPRWPKGVEWLQLAGVFSGLALLMTALLGIGDKALARLIIYPPFILSFWLFLTIGLISGVLRSRRATIPPISSAHVSERAE